MRTRLLGACCFVALLAVPGAHASVSGSASIGGTVQGVKETHSNRQLLKASRTGSQLSVRPKDSVVALITLELRDEAGTSRLVLAESELADGRVHLSVSAPDELGAALVRMTLFFHASATPAALFERRGDDWLTHRPDAVKHETTDGGLVAFVVSAPGDFWLLNEAYLAGRPGADIAGTLSTEHAGAAGRALWHWLWALIVLVASWGVSALRHIYESRKELS